MIRKLVLLTGLIVFVVGMLAGAFNVQRAEAGGTIYIRADGSVEGPANITTADYVTYYFTDNNYDEIVVERSNITIDGNGYTVRGTGAVTSNGIYLFAVSNVTIKNTNIEGFFNGILIGGSSDNTISENNITNNHYGIYLSVGSNNNNISRNNVTNNYVNDGITLYRSSNNILYANNITNSNNGILLGSSSSNNILIGNNVMNHRNCGIQFFQTNSNNTVFANNVTNSFRGMMIYESSNNTVSGNTMTNNSKIGIELYKCSNNTLSGNVMKGSQHNFVVYGYMQSHFMHSIDLSNLVNGKPVYYLVNQSDIVISPATCPQVGYLALVNCSNITVQGLTMTDNGQGFLLANTNNSRITDNNNANNEYGVSMYYSFNNILSGNNVTNNDNSGIELEHSSNNTISGNNIADNYLNFGIGLGDSSENTICGNNLTNNGISLYFYHSSDNTIFENNIADNKDYGIYLTDSPNNKFYHNNLENNTDQVYASFNLTNTWDNGFEGNHWSDYNGADLDYDGIGDSWHELDENNTDHYPLMGMFSSFNTSLDYNVNVISNSTMENFEYFKVNSTIRMHVSYEISIVPTFGFCRVCISHILMDVNNISVIIDDGLTPVLHSNYTLYDNGTHRWIYFAYEHSLHEIAIVQEFPSFLILPVFMTATLLIVIVYRRKH